MDKHTAKKIFPTDRIISGSLCYLERDDHILLLRRNRPPHQGKWTAPGGKMEHGESPQECVIREMKEETGYTLADPVLCGIVTVYDVAYPIHWLLFVFRASIAKGELAQTEEGELEWIPRERLDALDIPEVDRRYLQHVLNGDPLFQLKFVYDTPAICVDEYIY